jgi:hypothetical protein
MVSDGIWKIKEKREGYEEGRCPLRRKERWSYTIKNFK